MRLCPLVVFAVALAGHACATPQQQPLTGPRMGAAPASTAALPPSTSPFPAEAVPAPAAPRAPAHRQIGDATHALVRMQAEGTYAAPARPMPGDQAARAYQRYLDSFSHPIPERFDANLKQSQQQGN